mgnify:CR=1 FL=1
MGLEDIETMKPFDIRYLDFEDTRLMVSRTGFTGDLGYELWIDPDKAEALWDALFEAGQLHGIRAIGTNALEQARIEAGFLAAYHEFLPADETVRTGRSRSPFELGLDWLVDFKKPNFNGRRALAEEKRRGSTWRLVKLDIEDNKPAAVQVMQEAAAGTGIQILVMKTKYPMGGEKQTILSALRRTVPTGGLPLDVGAVVVNVGTASAIARAVLRDAPVWILDEPTEGLDEATLWARLEASRRALFDAREQRIHPYQDEKILTDWNGLMIAALAKGGRILARPDLVGAAVGAAVWRAGAGWGSTWVRSMGVISS